jgi:hypothetical protein
VGLVTIACYRPLEGASVDDVLAVLRDRLPLLRSEGLSTDHPSFIMRSTDGTVVEVSEWVSAEAVETAHHHPKVLELWKRFEQVCTYESVGSLPEAAEMFASFVTID